MPASEQAADPALDSLAGYAPFYLSPHYDDVCFSLGATALALGEGTLVNLFTRSAYLAAPHVAASKGSSIEEIGALRRTEDDRFASLCGLRTIALGLEEPALRGRRPHGPSLDDDLTQLEAPLLGILDELAARPSAPGPRALFCPAAIRSHVNHLATLVTVVRHLRRIEEKYCVFFYEDLFYAASYRRRLAGLLRLRMRLGVRHRAVRHVHRVDRPEEKLALVTLYPSQHKRPPTIARFSPATFPPSPVHEAFWEFRGPANRRT